MSLQEMNGLTLLPLKQIKELPCRFSLITSTFFLEECMAFGDQHNDIEMLHLAGEGYAMSRPLLRCGFASHSTYVTDSVIETLKELLE